MNFQTNNNNIVVGNIVIINGEKLPPCPSKNPNRSTIINNEVYIGGYTWKNKRWQKSFKAIWYNYIWPF